MRQSRATSFLKSAINTGVGFAVAFFANMLVLPFFGLVPSVSENLLLTTIYTVISIVRGYGLERAFEALGWRRPLSPFMAAVIAERYRQIDGEGWSIEHDDDHKKGELAQAGAAYALRSACRGLQERCEYDHDWLVAEACIWPWSREWWKPVGFRRDLVKGCALIVAEGEKHDRARKSKVRPSPLMTDDREVDHQSLVTQTNLAHGKTPSLHSGTSE